MIATKKCSTHAVNNLRTNIFVLQSSAIMATMMNGWYTLRLLSQWEIEYLACVLIVQGKKHDSFL
jgi:hypothetical protein